MSHLIMCRTEDESGRFVKEKNVLGSHHYSQCNDELYFQLFVFICFSASLSKYVFS